jgi:predicted metal-binding protein
MQGCPCGVANCPYPHSPRKVEHGKDSTYRNHKCRCDACTAASRLYSKKLREKMANTPRDQIEHGKYYSYVMYGCRCEPCTKTNTEYSAEYQKRTDYAAVRYARQKARNNK